MVFEKVAAIIADQLGIDHAKITLESGFRTDLEADSLSLFQIINEIEDEFDIRIDDTDGINTVADAVRLIEEQVK